MAKKNRIPTIYLFAGGTVLFSLAWLMPSFPLLAFIGLAPFFAIAVNNRAEKSLWTSMELILLGLSISFWAVTQFSLANLTISIVYGILFTLPFLGYAFARENLGAKASLIVILFFWLAIEYASLKVYPTYFLADLFILKPEWSKWTANTGYLGISLWILSTNALLFKALLTEEKINWLLFTLFLAVVIGPFVLSQGAETSPITRLDMLALYSNSVAGDAGYKSYAEWIARTSAWISVLIVLFTLVKQKTKRK
ncbi:MAG: hypothetical protein AB7O48_05710 [Cyclobacteriaceae bacterium]